MSKFTHGFEKVARIRGRALRNLRTILADKNYWAHGTRAKNINSIIQEGLQPAHSLASAKKLKSIEGIQSLTKNEVKSIAETGSKGYAEIQSKRNPHLIKSEKIKNYPVSAVSLQRGGIPTTKDFGAAAVLGKSRQLGTRTKKIIKEQGINLFKDLEPITSPKIGEYKKWLLTLMGAPKNHLHKERETILKYLRGRGAVSEMNVAKNRPIKVVKEHNVVVVPRASINRLRQEHRGITFIAREDLSREFPLAIKKYHKKR